MEEKQLTQRLEQFFVYRAYDGEYKATLKYRILNGEEKEFEIGIELTDIDFEKIFKIIRPKVGERIQFLLNEITEKKK